MGKMNRVSNMLTDLKNRYGNIEQARSWCANKGQAVAEWGFRPDSTRTVFPVRALRYTLPRKAFGADGECLEEVRARFGCIEPRLRTYSASPYLKNRIIFMHATHTRPPIPDPRSRLSIIVAMAENRAIGINNTLPWRCPEDLKHFKALTMGHHMIMGRKTFDSIGKPLPGRTTVVVTRNSGLEIKGCVVAHSLDGAISACAGDGEIFIVGGAELYRQALPLADTLYITEIRQDVGGDAHFPDFDKSGWSEISREAHKQEMPQPLEFHFVTYRRR